MKTLSIFYLLILFASALLPVFGNPVPSCNVGEACLDIIQRDEADITILLPSAIATIKYIQSHDVNKKPVLFYSGTTRVNGQPTPVRAFEKVADFKNQVHDVQILEDIIKEAKQDSQSWKDPEWNAVSEAFAQNVRDPVFVLLGKDLLQTSVYIKSERPALNVNTRVKKPLTIYEVQTNGSITRKRQ